MGFLLPYCDSVRNDKFCFVDGNRHVLYKLSWLAYAVYKGGNFDENIKSVRNGRVVLKKNKNEWDLRKCNLSFSRSKKPKIRSNSLLKKDIIAIGGIIASDEEFRPIKGESAVWISNYGRVISKRKGNPRLLHPVLNKSKNPEANQYWRLHLPQSIRGKKVKHCYYIHRLVAETFLEVPEWIKKDEIVDVHHINKIKGREHDPMINSYKNLMYVPRRLHASIDALYEIAVKKNNCWKKMNFLDAAAYYNLSPYDFIDAVGNEKSKKPDKVRGKYQYYSKKVLTTDGLEVSIDVRIIRERDKKN